MAELLSQSMEQQALLFKTEISALRADLTIQISTVQKLISKLDLVAGEQREQKKILNAHDGKRVSGTQGGLSGRQIAEVEYPYCKSGGGG
ncbi:UNVERIFIED_CONTAM: hypothetical protein FKN15_060003 [Acipenser sinensis]